MPCIKLMGIGGQYNYFHPVGARIIIHNFYKITRH